MPERTGPETFTVVISSTARDLPNHRDQVLAACLQQNLLPKMMEHLPARDDDAIAASLELVDEADLYLGVFAHRYGYVPAGHDVSITQMEYERAVERGIPRLIFLMGDDHPIKAGDVEAGAGQEKLRALKERLLADQVVRYFDSPADLRADVIHSLAEAKKHLAAPAAEETAPPDGVVLRTLLLSELPGKPALVEQAGDSRAAELFERHDREARRLSAEHGGREIERGDGFLLLFERPWNAVAYALDYHRALEELSRAEGVRLAARVGIHLGEVVLSRNPREAVARGARPLEVEGLAKLLAARLTSLASDQQTLLTRGAFDLARRGAKGEAEGAGQLRWLAHGSYLLESAAEPLEVFEVGLQGFAPLRPPAGSETAQRLLGQDEILGWRPAPGLVIPQRPHWSVERKLGEGGFGEVWLAEHLKTRARRVFKFCYEASRLRSLQREITLFRLLKEELGERDDIARILDWNFEEAPYFVESEYTPGGDLAQWCEEQGGLEEVPLDVRLEIVAQVATALAAAHSVGVLHKDVKPANVLITPDREGRPRALLTDFGVGAVLERERLAAAGITVLGLTAMTEEGPSSTTGTRLYMAPELLEGKTATLQADVYALGVVLYQMVVGDLTRALAPGWRRDVEDELLCEDVALAVDGSPERRLANPLRIAERLRTLPSRRQEREAQRREREASRRAREALAKSRKRRKLVAAVIAVLALFAGAMTYQASRIAEEASRARNEADRANHEAEVAQQVLGFMVNLFEVSDPAIAQGDTVTARELLDQGADKIRGELAEQPLTRARLMDTIGTVYHQLGLYEPAEPLLEEALAIRREQLGNEDAAVARSLVNVAELHRARGRYPEAEPLYDRSLKTLEAALGPDHPDLVKGLNGLGIVYWQQGRYEEAGALYRRSLEILEHAGQGEGSEAAGIVNNLALLHLVHGRHEEALQLFERALGLLETTHGPEDPGVAETLDNLGAVYQAQERYEAAERSYRRAHEIRTKILAPDHPDVAKSLNNLAEIARARDQLEAAEALYRRALDIWRKALEPDHLSLAIGSTNLAEVYRTQGRPREAEPLYRRALEIFEKVLGPDHLYVAYPLHGLATIYRDQRRPGEAEPLFRRALALRERELTPEDSDLQDTLREYAALLRSEGRRAEEEELRRRLTPVDPPPPP